MSAFAEIYAGVVSEECGRLGLPYLATRAFLEALCLKDGFHESRPVIHVQVHVLLARAKDTAQRELRRHFKVSGSTTQNAHEFRRHPDCTWIWLHRSTLDGQDLEWEAYEFARRLDEVAIIESTIWGMGKVPGELWPSFGNTSAEKFEEDAHTPRGQLLQFLRMLQVRTDGRALEWMRQGDFPALLEAYLPNKRTRDGVAKRLLAAQARLVAV